MRPAAVGALIRAARGRLGGRRWLRARAIAALAVATALGPAPGVADTRVFFIPAGFPAECAEELSAREARAPGRSCRTVAPFCEQELLGLQSARQALEVGSCEEAGSPVDLPGFDVVLLVDDRELGAELAELLGPTVREEDGARSVVPSRTAEEHPTQAVVVGESGLARASSEEGWRDQVRDAAGWAHLAREDEEGEPPGAAELGARVEALVGQARERCHVPEGGFTTGRQRADFYRRRSTSLVAEIMERAGRDAAAARSQIDRSVRAFAADTSVAGRDIPIDLTFAVAKSSREGGPGMVFSTSTTEVVSGGRDAHRQGAAGFDYLWGIRRWVPNHAERLRRVRPNDPDLLDPNRRPAWLQRRDLFIAGLAYARYAQSQFRGKIADAYADLDDATRERLLSSLSTDAKRAWVQATFARPGWMRPALRYLRRQAEAEGVPLDLNAILTDEGLVQGRHVPSRARTAGFSMGRARVTACEAWMLDQLGFARLYTTAAP